MFDDLTQVIPRRATLRVRPGMDTHASLYVYIDVARQQACIRVVCIKTFSPFHEMVFILVSPVFCIRRAVAQAGISEPSYVHAQENRLRLQDEHANKQWCLLQTSMEVSLDFLL